MNNREKIKQWVDQNPGAWKSTPVKDIMEATGVSSPLVYKYLPLIIAEREGIKPSEVLVKRQEFGGSRRRVDGKRIIELYESGMSRADIAVELDCHPNTVQYHLDKHNKNNHHRRIDVKRIIKLHKEGRSAPKIATELGCHPNTVRYHIRKHKNAKGTNTEN